MTFRLNYDWPYARFPSTEDYIADYVFVCTAAMLGVRACRLPMKDLRRVGVCLLAAAVVSMGFECRMLWTIYAG